MSGAEGVAALRREFDAQFASVPRDAPEVLDFLLVRIAARPYALSLAQLGGVAKNRTVVPAPSRRSEFMGLAGIRGKVVGVYGMAKLLGGTEDSPSVAWLALSRGDDPVAVAFDELEAFVRMDRSFVHDDAGRDSGGRLVQGVLKTEPVARPIVDLARVFAVVRRSANDSGSHRRGP